VHARDDSATIAATLLEVPQPGSPTDGRPDFIAAGAVLLMASIWGFNWVALKEITPDASPFVLSAIRVVIATAVLFALAVVMRRPLATTPPWQTFAAGMLQTGFFVILQNFALLTGGVGKTATLVYTMPLWAILIAPWALGERITLPRALALGLGLIGLGCILVPLDVAHGVTSKLLALFASFLWGAGVIYVKRFRARCDVDTFTFTAWQMFYTIPPLVLFALIMPGAFYHPSSWTFYPLLAMVAAGGTAGAFLLWMFVSSRLSAGTAGLSSLLVPVLSIVYAALLLGERPNPLEITGTILILSALAVNGAPQLVMLRLARAPKGAS
jgi:drug/metabolite transporter (DMT)-like permease